MRAEARRFRIRAAIVLALIAAPTAYAPDAFGRPTKVAVGATNYLSAIAYHPNGLISGGTYGNGQVFTQSLTARQQPSEMKSAEAGWTRRALVSALTMLELDEMMARYASYADLAEIVRHSFARPRETLKELFGRIVFNILCGNTDDHARNHAAFWNGETLDLTPAYDICPQGRAGGEATQAMLIAGDDRLSQIASCLKAAHLFLLDPKAAKEIVERQLNAIDVGWRDACDEAALSETDRALFWGRQFLNPYAFGNLDAADADLVSLADVIRKRNA